MRLVTFNIGNGPDKLGGLMEEGRLLDLALAAELRDENNRSWFSGMLAFIEAGERALDVVRRMLARPPEEACFMINRCRLKSPLSPPSQMRDFVAFERHMAAAGRQVQRLRERLGGPPAAATSPGIPPIWYRQPIYYKCNRHAATGSGTIDWPASSSVIDYELELACVIGKRGRDISAANAASHIFGYTVFNDLTARDLQIQEMQGPFGPAKGKDFDSANVLGPAIVIADEIGALPALEMRASVNGELWSSGNSASMHWSFPQIIEHVSRSETLHPGEVLGSGTVGNGCGLELGRFLMHRDKIVLEIEKIGSIETVINAPHVTERMIL